VNPPSYWSAFLILARTILSKHFVFKIKTMTLLSLFPEQPTLPAGFTYVENFITPQEELNLIEQIHETVLHPFHFQGYEAKRKVASFGYDYNFENKALTRGADIPKAFEPLIGKVANQLSRKPEDFVELLVTEYPVGSVINWHRDAFPFETIAGISLGSDCTFRLRPHDKQLQGRKSTISFTARRRSLYWMEGKARSEWQHSISPVSNVRYSITLRTLKTNL
jgi:alkylated DNA repair dioxygenase AlkB